MSSITIQKNRSVIFSWIISYLIILFIPVIATGVVYFVAKSIIETEINSSNRLLLEKIKDDIDNNISNVERLSMEIGVNPQISKVISLSGIDDGTQYYNIYEAASELKNFKILNNYIRGYYIYSHRLKLVLAPNASWSQSLYFDSYLASKGYTMEQWLEMLTKDYHGDYLLMPSSEDGTGDTNTIAFVRSLPFVGESLANIVIFLDFHRILANSQSDDWGDSGRSLLIMDESGIVVTNEGIDRNFSGLEFIEMKESNGNIVKTLKNKKVVVSYTTSKVNGWKYITITEASVFWSKARTIRNIMMGGFILCIIMGGFVSYFFIRKNYNPLKDIVVLLKDKLHSEADLKEDEYGFLKKAFSETIEQNQTIRYKLEYQNKALKADFITALLKGRKLVAPVNEMMTTYDISFKYGNFIVMNVFIEDIDEDFWNEAQDENGNKGNLVKFVITNVIEELLNRYCCGYMTEVEDMFACLINLDDYNDYKEMLLKVIYEAKSFLKENYKLSLTYSVGALHESIEGIPDAFTEALNAMEYSNVMGLSNTVFYDEIIEKTKNYYYYPIEKENLLISSIKSADLNACTTILEDIFRLNTVGSTPSLEIIKCLMFDLIGTVLKTANQIEKIGYEDFFEKINPVSEITKCKTFLEMKGKLLQIIESTCEIQKSSEYTSEADINTDYEIRNVIIEIIESNYSDPNLGIASIAEKINKPIYTVSRFFKAQTGEGILDYINKVRIDKAKEFLRFGTLNQKEVALKVGYTNVRTFLRVFKKIEGAPPGKLK